MKDPKRFVYETRPLALAHNVVVGKRCRFTVLTPNLIRLEYSPTGQFEDRASQSVFFRDFPQVDFTLQRHNGTLTIETEQLFLTCREDAPFAEDTLSIRLKVEPASTWHYGEEFEDLGGTVKTLDDVNGAITLERGVCSRGGFSVLDDSGTMLLNENGWVEVRRPDTVDCYFFGYGYRYLDAVKDFSRLTGVPPMLPAYALGNWWSRYHKYTQEEYCRLIDRFKQEEVPFSVSVIDMDWHLVDIPEHLQEKDAPQNGFFNLSNGWTGYTWNKELFPDHRAFLQYLKQNHLHTSLNLHPHAGVRRHE